MQIISVVTLLLGSIFAYSLAVPQYGSGLSAALAQLAQQLAKEQGNTTIKVGNNSIIVSGVSSSIANAHIDADRNQSNGWGNNGWGNNGWGYYNGYWRGVPDEEVESDEYAAEDAELEAEIQAALNALDHDIAEDDSGEGAEHDEIEDDAEKGAEHDEIEDDAEEGAEHDEVEDDVDSKEE
ncbi:uncharacterized protein LOC133842654 [Drosophila sulfurigaster albostrigata]|uniref:uncharacterized protein LOC133842654 n=1 Tax=Drosophila sulfurigaster albostrigata TaxID=89887 RepID=UPI002D21BF38|nr:uncharacterized protein LOC133842654 [Drosophila sulfurigaster albostrigata]